MNWFATYYSDKKVMSRLSFALLIVRFVMGTAFVYHGWGKIQVPFGWMPAEAGIPGFLQFLAALSEFGGGVALILGFVTPLAMLGMIPTMAVAAVFHISKGDPFVGHGGPSWELAGVYLALSVFFLLVGPGSYSVDAKIFKK